MPGGVAGDRPVNGRPYADFLPSFLPSFLYASCLLFWKSDVFVSSAVFFFDLAQMARFDAADPDLVG